MKTSLKRKKTRRERYDEKKHRAQTYPINIACVNFMHDGNLGYIIRAAACFGAQNIHVIGSVPSRRVLNPLSGSLYDYVTIKTHPNPRVFVDYACQEGIKLVSAELVDAAVPISSYNFSFGRPLCLVVGQEECGVPIEILQNSDTVYIPLAGVGYCLNTSQTANIMLYEAVNQYEEQQKQWKETWDKASYDSYME